MHRFLFWCRCTNKRRPQGSAGRAVACGILELFALPLSGPGLAWRSPPICHRPAQGVGDQSTCRHHHIVHPMPIPRRLPSIPLPQAPLLRHTLTTTAAAASAASAASLLPHAQPTLTTLRCTKRPKLMDPRLQQLQQLHEHLHAAAAGSATPVQRPPIKARRPFVSADNRPAKPDGKFRVVLVATGSVASVKVPDMVGSLSKVSSNHCSPYCRRPGRVASRFTCRHGHGSRVVETYRRGLFGVGTHAVASGVCAFSGRPCVGCWRHGMGQSTRFHSNRWRMRFPSTISTGHRPHPGSWSASQEL